MKHTIGERITIYGEKEIEIKAIDVEKGFYFYGEEPDTSIVTEKELEYQFNDIVVVGKEIYQIKAFYPINVLYDNEPAVYVEGPTGSGYRVNLKQLVLANEEQKQAFANEKELSKWRIYGREIGEFGCGDIVRFDGVFYEIQTIDEQTAKISNEKHTLKVSLEELEMISMKYDRFDLPKE